MSAHLREAWGQLHTASFIQIGEDKGIPVFHAVGEQPGSDSYQWAQQHWGDDHQLVLVETDYEGLSRSRQRYLPACMCGSSASWYSYSGRINAAEKFWQYHTKTEPWRTASLQVQFEVETNVPMRGVSRGGRRLWAIVDGKKAGWIVYKETGAMGAHLGMIEVSPSFRRSGIATALMDRFLQMYPYISVTPWTADGQGFWDSYKDAHPGTREPSVGFVSKRMARVASAPSIDKIMRLIVESGTIDLVRSLWEVDYSAGDLATDLDYEVEPLDSQFPELRQRFQAISQDRLRSMGLGPTLTVFRAGAVYSNMPMPTTLKRRTAETHRNFRGRDGSITEYEISLSDVLYYSEAIQPRGTFAEEEIGVMGRDMRAVETGARVGSKTASLRKGPGVFWRAHPKGRPFEVGSGSSQIHFTEEELKTHDFPEPLTRVAEGYSSFADPGHLWQYAVEMGWADDSGDWLTDPVDIIAFEGKIVGSGWDGEPTVRPTSQPLERMSWEEFNRKVDSWAAGEWYNGINMPIEAKTASTWRGFVNGDSPFWKQHDFTIATQMRGRERYFEVWVLGENFRNFPKLDEAKAAVEAEVGPLTWNRVTMPLEEVYHYWFGFTTEFTDPLTIYVADLW